MLALIGVYIGCILITFIIELLYRNFDQSEKFAVFVFGFVVTLLFILNQFLFSFNAVNRVLGTGMRINEKENAVAILGHMHCIWTIVIAAVLIISSFGIGQFTVIGEDYNFTVYAFTMAPVIVGLEALVQFLMIQLRKAWPSCVWEM